MAPDTLPKFTLSIARLVLLFACLSAAISAVIYAYADRNPLAFTSGATNGGQVIALSRNSQACQKPITVPETGSFDTIRFSVSTLQPPSPLVVSVRDLATGKVIGVGDLRGNYHGVPQQIYQHVAINNKVVANKTIAVCIRNDGRQNVALYGSTLLSPYSSAAFLNGQPAGVNLSLGFERNSQPHAALLPTMFERMALFHFPWLKGWMYWILLALLIVAVPILLAFSLRRALSAHLKR
jgi:hypothetical protein